MLFRQGLDKIVGCVVFYAVRIVSKFFPEFQVREREKKVGGGSERHYHFGGGCNRNIIWQFGRFPGSAR
jgi:hypothetical protein